MFTVLLEKIRQGNLSIEDIKAWISSARLSYAELLQEEYSDWLKNPNIPDLLSYAAIADFLRFEKEIHIEPETELGKYLVAIEGKIKEGLQLLEQAGNRANIIPIIEGLRNCSFGPSSTSETVASTLSQNPAIKELMPYYAGTKAQKSYQGKLFSIIKGINFAEEFRKKLSEAIRKQNYLQQKAYLIEAAAICMRAVESLWQVQQDLKIPSNKTERISNYVIKASLFLNAALVVYRRKLLKLNDQDLTEDQYVARTQLPWASLDSTEQEIITKISQIEQRFLQIAKHASLQDLSEQVEISPTQIAETWDDTVVVNKHFLENNIRKYAAGEIANVNFEKETFGPGYLTEEETEKVRIIYHTIADGIKALLTKVIEDCIRAFDTPPCAHAFMSLGSLAREEATPYSDLELAILLAENTPANRAYFYNLSVLITLKVQSLGETAIPKDLFKLGPLESFDQVVKPGLMLDLGGKTPIGRIDQGYSLIQTPEQMAEYIKDEAFRLGELLPIEMVTFAHVSGNQELTERYYQAVNAILNQHRGDVSLRQYRALNILKRDIEDKRFDPNLYSTEEEGKLQRVKEEIYRLPNLILDSLALYDGIPGGCSSWTKIKELTNKCFNKEGAENLKKVFSIATYLRLTVYQKCHAQNETFSVLFSLIPTSPSPQMVPGQESESSYYKFDTQQTKIFTEVYKILFPLHAAVKNFIKAQGKVETLIEHQYYDETSATLGEIASRLCDYEEAQKQFERQTNEEPQNFNGWHRLGLSLVKLRKKEGMIEALEKALELIDAEKGSLVIKAIILHNLSNAYGVLGNVHKRKELLERALGIKEKFYGHEHVKVAEIIGSLGNTYGDLGDFQKQKELLERALVIKEKFYGHEHVNVAKALGDCGTACRDLGNFQKQKDLLERALGILVNFYGSDHVEVAVTIGNLGNAYGDLGDFQKKKERLEWALRIKEKFYGAEHVEVAKTRDNLGTAYGCLGNVLQQKELSERALGVLEKFYGPDHVEVARTLNNLGSAYRTLGNVQEQKELLERALIIKEKFYGSNHVEVARALDNLGNTYGDLGDFQKKKELLERALGIKEKFYGSEHVEVARTLNSLGLTYGALDDFHKQKELLERALMIKEKFYGPEHVEVAKTIGNLGIAYGDLGDLHKQKELLERTLGILEKFYGPEHMEVVKALDHLCLVYGVLDDFQRQKELLERALMIKEKFYGPKHIEVAKTLMNLSNAYGDLGNIDRQKALLEQALAIEEKLCGKKNIEVAHTHLNLGIIYKALNKNMKALQHVEVAHRILKTFHPFNKHNKTAMEYLLDIHSILASTYLEVGATDKAIANYEAYFANVAVYQKAFTENKIDGRKIACAYHNLGCLYHVRYLQKGDILDLSLAESAFHKAKTTVLGVDKYIEYGVFLIKQQRYLDAYAIIQNALSMEDDKSRLSYGKMEAIRLDAKLRQEVENCGEIVISANLLGYYLIIKCCLELKKPEEIPKYLALFTERVIQVNTGLAYRLLGYCHEYLGNEEKSEWCFAQALSLESITPNQISLISATQQEEKEAVNEPINEISTSPSSVPEEDIDLARAIELSLQTVQENPLGMVDEIEKELTVFIKQAEDMEVQLETCRKKSLKTEREGVRKQLSEYEEQRMVLEANVRSLEGKIQVQEKPNSAEIQYRYLNDKLPKLELFIKDIRRQLPSLAENLGQGLWQKSNAERDRSELQSSQESVTEPPAQEILQEAAGTPQVPAVDDFTLLATIASYLKTSKQETAHTNQTEQTQSGEQFATRISGANDPSTVEQSETPVKNVP